MRHQIFMGEDDIRETIAHRFGVEDTDVRFEHSGPFVTATIDLGEYYMNGEVVKEENNGRC